MKAAVENAGFFTGLQALCDEGGVRLVCATDGGAWGLGGISFWISFQGGRWFIASWAPFTYEVPANIDVADVAIASIRAAMAHPARFYFDIDDTVKSRFALKLISEEQFDGICGI